MADEKKKRDLSHVEFAEHPPKWIKPSDLTFINENNDIKTVINFFVVYSPCSNVSARGIDLTKYNWKEKNPPKNQYLYNVLLSTANLIEGESLFIGEGVNYTKDLFSKANMHDDFYYKYTSNRVALVNNGNLIMTIFKAIRNCFAHCRFTIMKQNDDYLIAMENGLSSSNKFEVKGRLLLKLSTLIEWIRIIKEDYEESVRFEQQHTKQIENELFDIIRKKDYINTDDMVSKLKLHFDEKDIKSVKKRLIELGIIEYSKKEKRWEILLED